MGQNLLQKCLRDPRTAKTGGPQKDSPIEAPSFTLEELNKMTDNFGSKALIEEGKNCRVFYGKLSDGAEVVIKKLDGRHRFYSTVPDVFVQLSEVKEKDTSWFVNFYALWCKHCGRIAWKDSPPHEDHGRRHQDLGRHVLPSSVLPGFGKRQPKTER
ncbi:hypothetical protein L6452_38820 [Arctium lappa]|uniref:Uncharacterized protein n=1 Tax=Arctium lappa TaxID=4217 RepID=A0ACB8XUP6_ARCLA|nr:hypothetical protein L6452_38820 [Arctium lappa]